MIDLTKHVAIFSSPRVGSSWFQESLRQHYSMMELFNTDVKFRFENHTIIPDGVRSRDTSSWYNGDAEIIGQRIQKWRDFEHRHQLMSFKTHTFMLDDRNQIIEFASPDRFQYIVLDRKDKLATLMSYVIALHTQEYSGKATTRKIQIKENKVHSALYMMGVHAEVGKNLLQQLPDCKLVYYEDALNYPDSEWWKSSDRVVVQNARAVTTIINQDQVNDWISKIDFSRFEICL